jgi:hypothetical protein
LQALVLAMRTGAPIPEFVDPPLEPPMPRLSMKQEFIAQFYDGTSVSALPYTRLLLIVALHIDIYT